MKKLLFIAVAGVISMTATAQSVTTYYQTSENYIELRNLMETRDGNIIMNCPMFDQDNGLADLGTWLYKVSPQGELLDSFFIEDNDMRRFLLIPNPVNESNYIFASVSRDFDTESSSLRIRFFTDNPIELQDEIYASLQDTIVELDALFIDPDNDIIVTYSASERLYLARVGLDGTLKDKTMLPKPSFNFYQYQHLGLFRESPREYCLWGSDTKDNFAIYNVVADSLLNFVGETKLNSAYSGGCHEQILYLNDSTYALSSSYTVFHPYVDGLHLSIFNRDNECLKAAIFPDENDVFSAFPIWAAKGASGGFYYSYDTDAAGTQVAVVKLDDDLNVCWKRYCLKEGPFHWGMSMIALSNGGVAVGGFDSRSGPEHFRVFLIMIDDDGSSVNENGDILKPFAAYPNPAYDMLRLDISPDVIDQVNEISLYDISGCLVKAQQSGFGSIDISGLATGMYVMKVTLDDGKVLEEKIVKK